MIATSLGERVDHDTNVAGCRIDEGCGMRVRCSHINTDCIILKYHVVENAVKTLLDNDPGSTSAERHRLDLVLLVVRTQVDPGNTPIESQVTHYST